MHFPPTQALARALVCGSVGILATTLPAATGAAAQGRLEAQYVATLAGLPVGKGSWTVSIGDDRYSAVVNGGTTGLLKVFAGATGSGAAQGRVVNGQLSPANYVVSTTSRKKTETIRISLAGGNIKNFSIEPEEDPNPNRIPVTEAHKRGVLDPLTASLPRVPGAAAPLGPDACEGVTSIFDGRMRYELRLAYKRMEAVKAKGYQGPSAVCALYFTPVAGYVPDRTAIKYLAAQRDIEVWFVPIAGTRLVAPFKVTIPTPLGTGMLEATDFTTIATAVPPPSSRTQ